MEPAFLLMYYGGFLWREILHLPVSYKRWFIERISRELKRTSDEGNTQSRAAHQNTPDIRAPRESACANSFKIATLYVEISDFCLSNTYLVKHLASLEVSVNKKQPLNELHVNLIGKLFFATLSAWLLGRTVNTKLRGNSSQIEAVVNALSASRRFQDELNRPGATVDSVVQKLGIKHMSATEFERVLGVPWPL